MGYVGFDGSMNTGLMLRSIHVHDGAHHVRVGATLLFDSVPEDEERETELKASAMLDVIRYCNARAKGEQADDSKMKPPAGPSLHITDKNEDVKKVASKPEPVTISGEQPRMLLIDCQDSFVHTLAGYFRMCGAQVHTRQVGFSADELEKDIEELRPHLICLSPGPGSPTDFGLAELIERIRAHQLPIFGVCLGLQALVEYFGGELGQLETPMHGKVSEIDLEDDSGKLFVDVAPSFEAGRYHSLFADEKTFPFEQLKITARTHEDDVVMAIEHKTEPIAAVQFHPESIMTLEGDTGLTIVRNALEFLAQ
jgi:anthranilate synthase